MGVAFRLSLPKNRGEGVLAPGPVKTILVIDDEKEICRSLKGILSDEGYEVHTAQTPDDALAHLGVRPPHLILLDIWFGKSSWDGMHLLDQLKQLSPLLPIIMISGHGTLELAARAIKKGAYDFIEKPIDVDRLLLCVSRALEASHLKTHFAPPRPSFKAWPLPLDPRLKKAAFSETRILLLGEAGLQKKRLAQALHALSPRQEGPLIFTSGCELNAMSEEEMLGREAQGQVEKLGFLEYARGGTLVVHHVHTLTPRVQHLFAKVFEAGAWCRVDATKPSPLNVRFIATAFPDFVASSSRENFRKDFYDRITLFPFTVSPLREKKQDIALWADAFLQELSLDLGLPRSTLTEEALQALQTYDWPGNARELRNVLEHTLLSGPKARLTPSDLPVGRASLFSSFSSQIFSLPLPKARLLFEYTYMQRQLASCNGNISQAAQAIGMDRSALHRKLRDLKMKARELGDPFLSL